MAPAGDRSASVSVTMLIARLLALMLTAAVLGPLAQAKADTTTTIGFDPPQFSSGQVLSRVGGVSFPDSPVVFTPSVATQSPPQALRRAATCHDAACSSGAATMRFEF